MFMSSLAPLQPFIWFWENKSVLTSLSIFHNDWWNSRQKYMQRNGKWNLYCPLRPPHSNCSVCFPGKAFSQTQKQTLWQTLAPMCQTCIRNLILTFSVINVPLCIFFFFNQDLINAFGNILINCKIVFITLCRIIMPVPRYHLCNRPSWMY